MTSKAIKALAADVFSQMVEKHKLIVTFKQPEQVHFSKFLVHNFESYSPSYLDHLMFATKIYWQKFTIKDWSDLMVECAESEFAITYCLSFLYRYIQIDSLVLFENLPKVKKSTKRRVLAMFKKRSSLLTVVNKIYVFQLAKFNLTKISFKPITKRLILEGATRAKKISPIIIKVKLESGHPPM